MIEKKDVAGIAERLKKGEMVEVMYTGEDEPPRLSKTINKEALSKTRLYILYITGEASAVVACEECVDEAQKKKCNAPYQCRISIEIKFLKLVEKG